MSDSHEPVRARWLEVKVEQDDSFERAVRRFTKRVRADGILFEVRERASFVKPSARRRSERNRAARLRMQDNCKRGNCGHGADSTCFARGEK